MWQSSYTTSIDSTQVSVLHRCITNKLSIAQLATSVKTYSNIILFKDNTHKQLIMKIHRMNDVKIVAVMWYKLNITSDSCQRYIGNYVPFVKLRVSIRLGIGSKTALSHGHWSSFTLWLAWKRCPSKNIISIHRHRRYASQIHCQVPAWAGL